MPVCRIRDRNVWEWIWDPFCGGFMSEELRGKAVRCGWVVQPCFRHVNEQRGRRLTMGLMLKTVGRDRSNCYDTIAIVAICCNGASSIEALPATTLVGK